MLPSDAVKRDELLQAFAQLSPEKQAQALQKLQARRLADGRMAEPAIPLVDRTKPIPAAFPQEQLWFLQQLQPASVAYNERMALRLEGPLNRIALEAAIQRIVQRHEALRTTFAAAEETALAQTADSASGQSSYVVQVIHPYAESCYQLIHEQLPTGELAELQARADHFTLQPFDLSQGPLWRVVLFALTPDVHVFLLVVHHIIADAWGMAIFLQEVAAGYTAFCAEKAPQLPPLSLHYADFAHWQRQQLQGEALARQLRFWQASLQDAPLLLQLPTDAPRPLVQSEQGGSQHFCIGQALTQPLKALSRQSDATLYMTLLSAFTLLLYRYTGQEDIVVGSVHANRTSPALEKVIGHFVNTTPLRTRLTGQLTFRQLLAQVRQQLEQSYAHQTLPFQSLVQAIQPERTLSYHPLYQVSFNFQNQLDIHSLSLVGLKVEPLFLAQQRSKLDLYLMMFEQAGELQGVFEYSRDLFEPTTIQRLIGHFQQVLTAIVATPDQRLNDLPLLTAAERQQLLVEWNNTATAYPPDKLIHQLFEAQAARTPDATAVVMAAEDKETRRQGDRVMGANNVTLSPPHPLTLSPPHPLSLSYAELNERANQLAHHLLTLGVKPDTLVAVVMERSLEMVVSLLAVLKAGGAYLPIDPAYPAERIHYMLADSATPILLTQSHLAVARAAPQSIQHVICLDTLGAHLASLPKQNPQMQISPAHLAYTIYTSGSTGQPKGIAITHANVANFLLSMQQQPGLTPDDKLLALTTIAFDIAVLELYLPLTVGAAVILASTAAAADPAALIRLLQQHQITVAQATPVTWRMLTEHPAWRTTRPLKILCGGEALPLPLARQLLEHSQRVWNMYGPTETTVWVSAGQIAQGIERVTIAPPLANTTFYLLDQAGQVVPIGVAGELHIGGAQLARGYLNRPELTAARFIEHPQFGRLYKTGDLCRWLVDGTLEYMGRTDFQVKLRGFRIELGEIEQALLAQAGVRAAVVVAREDNPGDKRLVAYLVLDQETRRQEEQEEEMSDSTISLSPPLPVSLSDLRKGLQARLPEYMIPAAFVVLEALPLTPNGKLDRKALPAPAYAEGGRAFVAPRNALEAQLAALWAEVLGVAQVGVYDNFFALGGHSLLATQVISRLRTRLNLAAPLKTLFAAPQVAAFAECIKEMQSSAHVGIRPAARAARLPLSFAQQRLWFLDQLEPNSALYNIPALVHLAGAVDVAALEESFRYLIARHESLRTTFAATGQAGDSDPSQVIAAPAAASARFTLPVIAVADLADARQRAQADAATPFLLTAGPLLRVQLFQLSATDYLLALVMHHSISDGWSLGVLWAELSQVYHAYQQGAAPDLPGLPIQYADFAVWQRQFLSGDTLDRQLSFWRTHLAGAPVCLELPTAPRPPVQSHRGAHYRLPLARELTDSLKQLTESQDATLFMGLLAAFNILLARYSGQQDVVVGTPIANRHYAETEGLIGLFVNTLVLRTQVGDNPSFRALLDQVRQSTLAAYEHQDLPFEQLVDALHLERTLSYSPLFQVMLVFQNTPTGVLTLPNVTATLAMPPFPFTKFDLTLHFMPNDNGLAGLIEYSTDLFSESAIARLADHFVVLLKGIIANPDQPIGQLPLLTAAEYQQLVYTWNDTAVDWGAAQTLHALFEQQAARTPASVAVVMAAADEETGGQDDRVTGANAVTLSPPHPLSLSYAELNARANQLAHHLIALGVQADTLVAVALERSPAMVISLLAVLKAGGAYIPIDPTYPAARIRYLLTDSAAPILLTQSHLAWVQEIAQSSASGVKQVIAVDQVAAQLALYPTTNPQTATTAKDLAYVIYTSGSTGEPKGVMIPHQNVTTHLHWLNQHLALTPTDVILQKTPYSFDASVWEIFAPLLCGAQLVLAPVGVPQDIQQLHLVLQQGITLVQLVPTQLRLLLSAGDWTQYRALRQVVCGGEQLTGNLLTQLFAQTPHLKVHNFYGPTETTIQVVCWSTETPVASPPIGLPVANTQVYILDEQMALQPFGVAGELYIGGAQLARGYLNRPELTAERFIQHPTFGRLYKTGDRCRWWQGPTGAPTIAYLGRTDFQIKLRGFRIELGEIENGLLAQPGVRAAVVTVTHVGGAAVREPNDSDERLVAYFVGEVEGDTLRRQLGQCLPEYMVPALFVQLAALPLTPNGKVDRKALPAPAQAALPSSQRFAPPSTPTEIELAQIWCSVLRLAAVGIDHNFFALGGDSILSIQVVARARQAGLRITPRQMWQAQTIRELAALAVVSSAPPTEQAAVTGALPLTPIQRWFFAQQWAEPHHFNQAVLLETPPWVNRHWVEAALNQVWQHHDALRMRFSQVGQQWRQWNAPVEQPIHLHCVDLAACSAAARPAQVEAEANRLQATFDLAHGPLLQAVYFTFGAEPGRLLLVIHHLVVDGVSWRILLEDLQQSYAALAQGAAPQLPPKTTAYHTWAHWLASKGVQQVAAERAYWQALCDQPQPAAWPVDYPEGLAANRVATVENVTCLLPPADTAALLNEAPPAYHTQINDLLLAALAQTLCAWTGTDAVLIDLEGHGRELWDAAPTATDDNQPSLDLARTVGWFTALFPVRLPGRHETPAALIKTVKETLRRIPNRGIGYGILRYLQEEQTLAPEREPVVSFNYLGQFDNLIPTPDHQQSALPLFTGFAHESSGNRASPSAKRPHLIDINGQIIQGKLQLTWSYSPQLHQRATIAALAQNYIANLQALLAHCRQPAAGGFTPSDFPLLALAQTPLDQLVAEVQRTADAPLRQIEDLYPLAPSQQGMFLDALAPASAQRSTDKYLEISLLDLHGELETGAFTRAWQTVMQRHPALRTGFVWYAQTEPVQFVLKQLPLPLDQEDWRALSVAEQQTRQQMYIQTLLDQGLPLIKPPLFRLALWRTAEQCHRLLWLTHHILVDGWCLPVLLDEVLALYQAQQAGQVGSLPAAPPYRLYIQWLQGRDLQARAAFWRHYLQGFHQPTPLGLPTPHPAPLTPAQGISDRYGDCNGLLSAQQTARLRVVAQQQQVTLNTLVQSVWALLLYRYSGQHDLLFGATVAGRPAQIAGVERMVGLLINTIPVRLTIAPATPFPAWLVACQRQQIVTAEYADCSAGQIQGWSEVPGGLPLFQSLLVFQNYPSLNRAADNERAERAGLVCTPINVRGAHTPYPLTIIVVPAPELALSLVYDRTYLPDTAARQIVDHWLTLFEAITADPQQSLAQLAAHIPAGQAPEVYAFHGALRLTPDRSADAAGPPTPTEAQLVQIWEQLLGVQPVGIDDHFFDLGGHSLLATQVVARIRQTLAFELPLRQLFATPTIRSLAAVMDREDAQLGQRALLPAIPRAARTAPLPLSFAQERLWFASQYEEHNASYNESTVLRVAGCLDVAALEKSLQTIVERHESLRTTFHLRQGGAVVQVVQPANFVLRQIDAATLTADGQTLAIQPWLQAEAQRPFVLTQDLLLRATLLVLGESAYLLLLTMHHIASDGWSLHVFLRELSALYAAFGQGEPAPLPALPIQYADYALWQRQWLQGDRLAQGVAWWKQHLLGPNGALPPPLPFTAPRLLPPPPSPWPGDMAILTVDAACTQQLRQLSQQAGATLFMTLLAAFALLVSQANEQEELVVGMDVAGRNQQEVEDLIGFFVNILAWRADSRGNPTFAEWLARVRTQVLALFDHQETPFAKVVEALHRETNSYQPLVQALFVMQNIPPTAVSLPGLTVQVDSVPTENAKFDLVCFVRETDDTLTVFLHHHRARLAATVVQRLADHFVTLLHRIAVQPGNRLHTFVMPTTVERRQTMLPNQQTQSNQGSALRNRQRRAVEFTQTDLVKSHPLHPDAPFPLVIEPNVAHFHAAEWAKANRDWIERQLLQHGALLLRGFAITAASAFEAFAGAICPDLFGEYGDLPHEAAAGNIYHSTPYPPDQAIHFHNESAHMQHWPRLQWFCCVQPAPTGGATPLVDCRQVYQRLEPRLRTKFEEKKLMYVRNFTDKLDVSWSDFFQTHDRAVVEAYCQRANIGVRWKPDNALMTYQIRPAVLAHPKTGERTFFNQMQVHHISCLDPATRTSLLALFDEADLPRNVYFGDGTPIQAEEMAAVRALYDELAVRFAWQQGDVVMVDNMLVAHGRDPYSGPRKILVALGEMVYDQTEAA